ncbi:MAG: LCP family protein, partial [Acidimicrobiales bacterium]
TDGRWHSDPTADLGRITRQQVFIRRAISKAVGKGLTNPATLNQLVSAGVDNVRLDHRLSAGDLLDLGRQFARFNSQDLVGYSLPSEPFRTGAGAAVQRPLMREAEPMLNIFRGLPPGTISPGSIDVTVLNGSGRVGQAADVAGAMKAIGFAIKDVRSYSRGAVAHTTVFFGQGGEVAARLVARHITGGAPLVADPNVRAGEVVVVTGRDFTTVHDQPAPEGSPDDLRSTTPTTVGVTSSTVPGATTTLPPTTTTTEKPAGYSTGEPPAGVRCG